MAGKRQRIIRISQDCRSSVSIGVDVQRMDVLMYYYYYIIIIYIVVV